MPLLLPPQDQKWYVRPALHYYRCCRCHIKKTNRERISDTVKLFPHTHPTPKTASKDAVTHAALDLIYALQNPARATPFSQVGQKQMDALRKLADIFQTALPQEKLTPALGNHGSNMRQLVVQPRLPAV
eukprot:3603313-Ditylum_brightwellii.AAC.1